MYRSGLLQSHPGGKHIHQYRQAGTNAIRVMSLWLFQFPLKKRSPNQSCYSATKATPSTETCLLGAGIKSKCAAFTSQKAAEVLELNPNNLPGSKTVSPVIKEEYSFIKLLLCKGAPGLGGGWC